MTDQTNAAALIAQAEVWRPAEVELSPIGAYRLIESLAAALEDTDQEATVAHTQIAILDQRLKDAEERTAGLAAVVEKVREQIEGESGWFRHRAGRVFDILATAPADALREVKADVWDEGVNAEARAAVTASPRIKNPYRAREEKP